MQKKIYIAGHQGMVGSALHRKLSGMSGIELIVRTRTELDLVDQAAVNAFFHSNQVDEVYLAAAKVGGIHANNTYPADFIYNNIVMQANVIDAAYRSGVKKLLLLGSSCIYPRLAQQPMSESALLSGDLEPTNEPYAIAKIAGIKLCESYNRQYGVDYRSVMPTNLYGENDNFHPENSHVIPAMMRRFHQAKLNSDDQVMVWGSGKPMREFMHVDDMAQASIHVMGLSSLAYRESTQERIHHINLGTGVDCTIAELALTMKQVVDFNGELIFDVTKPDGAPRKLLNVARLESTGWHANISLQQGLTKTYQWFLRNETDLRGV